MKYVYECNLMKKRDIEKMLETDPYAENSFSRIGYKTKEGAIIEEDKSKFYVYISSDETFMKKTEEKLKGLAERTKPDIEKRIISLIEKEEESAVSGFGNIFG